MDYTVQKRGWDCLHGSFELTYHIAINILVSLLSVIYHTRFSVMLCRKSDEIVVRVTPRIEFNNRTISTALRRFI